MLHTCAFIVTDLHKADTGLFSVATAFRRSDSCAADDIAGPESVRAD